MNNAQNVLFKHFCGNETIVFFLLVCDAVQTLSGSGGEPFRRANCPFADHIDLRSIPPLMESFEGKQVVQE